MSADLARAMKARDRAAVSLLRATLAAFANAEAPPAPEATTWPPPVVGRLVEHPRIELSHADHERIVRDEIADREAAIAEYAAGGRHDEAAALQTGVALLVAYLA
ncbi:MAG TPA: hypothetical protein VFH36_14615 [Acidimicrobiales bacterium]|nr:hypothetical protein [Acidimicrobiales bacterium]